MDAAGQEEEGYAGAGRGGVVGWSVGAHEDGRGAHEADLAGRKGLGGGFRCVWGAFGLDLERRGSTSDGWVVVRRGSVGGRGVAPEAAVGMPGFRKKTAKRT